MIPSHPGEIQGSAKRRSPGLVHFVTALAYHCCLAWPAAFTQPGAHLLAEPCILHHPSLPFSIRTRRATPVRAAGTGLATRRPSAPPSAAPAQEHAPPDTESAASVRSNPVVPQRHLTSPFRIRSPDGVRFVLEPEQHVPGGDGGDVDVALALRLRGLQGQQRHLPDQV